METAQESELPLLFIGKDESVFDSVVNLKNAKLIERFV